MSFIRIAIVPAVLLLAACASTRNYAPVAPASFDELVANGCAGVESRFNITANVNAAFKETVVIWNGSDASRTMPLRLPKQGRLSRMRGAFGESIYDVNLEVLRGLATSGQQATFALACDHRDRAPSLIRVRYMDNGVEREIEFN